MLMSLDRRRWSVDALTCRGAHLAPTGERCARACRHAYSPASTPPHRRCLRAEFQRADTITPGYSRWRKLRCRLRCQNQREASLRSRQLVWRRQMYKAWASGGTDGKLRIHWRICLNTAVKAARYSMTCTTNDTAHARATSLIPEPQALSPSVHSHVATPSPRMPYPAEVLLTLLKAML